MAAGGPLRIAAWFTWSGRERSSQSRSPQVPQIRLASYLSLPFHPFLPLLVHLFKAACIVARVRTELLSSMSGKVRRKRQLR